MKQNVNNNISKDSPSLSSVFVRVRVVLTVVFNVNNNSSFQKYTNPDDHARQILDTPGFKPFNKLIINNNRVVFN